MLAGATLAGALALALALTVLRAPLDRSTFLGLPLGFALAAIGLPLAWVAIAFRFARRQGEIDRSHSHSGD